MLRIAEAARTLGIGVVAAGAGSRGA